MKMEHVQRVQGDNVWDFEMDIGLKLYFLSTGLKQVDDETFISRKKYAKEIIKKFKLVNCKPLSTLVDCDIKLSEDDNE